MQHESRRPGVKAIILVICRRDTLLIFSTTRTQITTHEEYDVHAVRKNGRHYLRFPLAMPRREELAVVLPA